MIAFLPFPTFLLGHDEPNPLSVIIYAGTLFVASAMEIVLFRHARRKDLLAVPLTEPVYRFGVLESMSPLFAFAIAIPVAFLSSSFALYCFLLAWPIAALIHHRRPAEVVAFDAALEADGPL